MKAFCLSVVSLPEFADIEITMSDAPPANVQETYDYNNRMQPVRIQLGTPGNPSQYSCLAYNYYYGILQTPTTCSSLPAQATQSDNGDVNGYLYVDNVNPNLNHSTTFTFDTLNRLTSAVATGNSTYNLTFAYDRWGNMGCQTNGQTQGPCPNWSFNTGTNQINTSGFDYDAAGNLTTDGVHTYQWDAEGRLASVDGGTTETYTHNALGQEVRLSAPNWYTWDVLYDPAGGWMGRWSTNAFDVSGVFQLGGRKFAIYLDQADFIHENALGSTNMITNAQGVVNGDTQQYPWGQNWLGGTPEWHYGAFEYGDSATDLYPTPNRQYANGQGRWLSPDPLGGDISNPQSLNRYAYVLNNPATLTDPLGLRPCPPGARSMGNGNCIGPQGPGSGNRMPYPWDPFDLLFKTWYDDEGTIHHATNLDALWLVQWLMTHYPGPPIQRTKEGKSCISRKSLPLPTRGTLALLSWAAMRSGGVRAIGIGGSGAFSPPSLAGGGGSVQALWMADYLGQQGLYWSVSGGPTVGQAGGGAAGGAQYMTSTSNTNVTVQDVVNSSLSAGGALAEGFAVGADVNLQTGVFTETIGFGMGGFGGAPGSLNVASGFIPICHE